MEQPLRANAASIFARDSATINFCEPNYVHSAVVAEWWGTWSALLMVLQGAAGVWLGLRHGIAPRHCVLWLHLVIVGIGTMYLHATLAFFGQACDELPMIILALNLFYCLITVEGTFSAPARRLLAAFLTATGALAGHTTLSTKYVLGADAKEPWIFPFVFGAIMSVLIAQELRLYVKYDQRKIRRLYERAAVTFVGGFAVWLLDMHLCDTVQWLQLHAAWHVLTCLAAHYTFIWMVAIHAEASGRGLPASLVNSPMAANFFALRGKHEQEYRRCSAVGQAKRTYK